MNDIALVLIDLQNDYFAGGANPLVNSFEAVLNAQKVLYYFRSRHWPIFHIQHIATSSTATFFLPSTTGAAIHEQVIPEKGESLIIKHFPNSFRDTTLLTELRALNITNLVICGMMTHMCIDATVRAAKDLGFSITIIEDACATKDLSFKSTMVKAVDVHYAFISALGGTYAKILDTTEYFSDK